jgi:N-acetylneuraminate synthase
MNSIKIHNKIIGEGYPVFIIAEAGANFRISNDDEENFKQALKLIDIATEAKADAVKFQLYRAERLYVKNAGEADYIGNKKSIYQIIKEMELLYEWLPKLKEYCDKRKIIFLCTPFDEKSVDELEKLGVSAYKIASYTITHLPLLRYIAKKGKPIILSTGASDLKDIEKAVKVIQSEGNDQIALMQCTAKYPAPLSTMNLKTIPLLKKEFGTVVGLSDHSRDPLIAPLGAVILGAKMIEKHFTTDNNLLGPDHGFAVVPEELTKMVDGIRKIEKTLGNSEKKILEEEKELYNFARRYIYAIKDIKIGEVFSRDNIAVLRSGKKEKGLSPNYFEGMIKKKTRTNLKKGDPINKEDVD